MAKEVSRKITQAVLDVNYTVDLSLDEVIFLFKVLSQCCGICHTEAQYDITLKLYQFLKSLIGYDNTSYTHEEYKLMRTDYYLKDNASDIIKKFKTQILESLQNENPR